MIKKRIRVLSKQEIVQQPILFALIAALSAGTVFSVRKKEEN